MNAREMAVSLSAAGDHVHACSAPLGPPLAAVSPFRVISTTPAALAVLFPVTTPPKSRRHLKPTPARVSAQAEGATSVRAETAGQRDGENQVSS